MDAMGMGAQKDSEATCETLPVKFPFEGLPQAAQSSPSEPEFTSLPQLP